MSITSAVCNSFKQELLGGIHDLDTDTIKVALIKVSPTGTYNADTTNYTEITDNSDEALGAGYTVGGNTLAGASITLHGSTAIVDYDNTTWSSVTISADGCIIYNSSKSDRAIAILSFGGVKTSLNGDLTIQLPSADSSNAIIRIA
tara:strand:+ start:172 stop:609 length:438 start_codon:yes stop_codon:yes gene_type:complete